MLKNICLAFLLSVTALTATAQSKTLATPAEVRKFADGVLSSVGSGNYEAACKEMKPISVIPSAEFDVFTAQFASQRPSLLQRFGSAMGSEFVREEKAGESLIKLSYLAKHEKSGMRWLLVFYRADSGWVLTDFKFDGNIDALFIGH